MMKTDMNLQAGLRSLQASLRQIRSLLAWEQLRQSERRPGQPPSFQMHDPLEVDLRNEYSFFLSISTEMHALLNQPDVSITEHVRAKLKQSLAKLDQQIYQFDLHRRVWRC